MIITSFSKDGFSQYGQRFLSSWEEHVKKPLVVYSEDDLFNDLPDWVDFRSLDDVMGYKEFLDLCRFEVMHGRVFGKYNYRFDIAKFCKKCFAQIDAAASTKDQYLTWIDADTEFSADIFDVKPDGFMAYLGRPEWHSCASFVVWNLKHEKSDQFWQTYWQEMFLKGTLFCLPEWHDSFILDWLRKELMLPSTNLADGMYLPGPANVFNAVFDGKARHLKGNLKRFRNRYEELYSVVSERMPEKILEVGTWNGRRAAELCKVNNSEYIGFDLFDLASDETDETEKNVKKHYSKEEVEDYLESEGIKYTLVKGNTRDTLPGFAGEEVDFAFIDGGHSLKTIRSDWKEVQRLVSSGGLVVFDDYYEGMPEDDLRKWGANMVIKDLIDEGFNVKLGSALDPVKGGGHTRLVFVSV